MAIWSEVSTNELFGSFRLDAECYSPEVVAVYDQLASLETVRLGDHAFITDGQHGYHKVDPASPIRHLTAKCIKESFIDDTGAERLSLETHQKNLRSSCAVGDVLLSTAGTVGNAGIVTANILPANMDQDLARIHLRDDRIDPWYLVAFLNSRIGRLQSERVSTGQVQKHIALEKIREFSIPVCLNQKPAARLVRTAFAERQLAQRLYNQAENLLIKQLGLSNLKRTHRNDPFYINHLSNAISANRVDAEYFQPHFQNVLETLRTKGRCIADVANLRRERFRPVAEQPFHYIEIGDVSSDGTASASQILGFDAPSRAQWIVRRGDVITSLVRPIRRLTALIGQDQDGYVCSSGFAVLGPYGVSPEVLAVYLRLPIIAELLDLYTTASMYPAISSDELMRIPFRIPSERSMASITHKIAQSRAAHEKSRSLIEEAKALVEVQVLAKG